MLLAQLHPWHPTQGPFTSLLPLTPLRDGWVWIGTHYERTRPSTPNRLPRLLPANALTTNHPIETISHPRTPYIVILARHAHPAPQAINSAHADMGLEVHGLLVASTVSEAMRKLCTDVHVFKSWTAVPGGNDYMYT